MADVLQTAAEVQGRPALRAALAGLLYQMADDELVIGHRDSEWLGVGPEIEEDVAFSSISQDEVGHAVFCYRLLADLGEGDSDSLAFERPASARRNALLTERGNGDWAFTIARHYFYDTFDRIRLEALSQSSYEPLRQGVVKMMREEYYHGLHVGTWFRKLAIAGGEAKERLQRAVDTLWADIDDLFALGAVESELLAAGILSTSTAAWKQTWLAAVTAMMETVGLKVPAAGVETVRQEGVEAWSRLHHSPALEDLLATMNEVRDLDRAAVW
ncbi:phenylacetate-CoA oxygenase subunit PaaC [Alicyclobacillus cycloheptanicus]|uniref:Ring-1,2-phenylacetyl-CoA epoxidase subunit PaaC n=1 Tax=Alicyclobacillus cycloheptanicus TaxID=1457 RepID=A0ABT9XG05_9BACL|nr:1,2-phenylacetyl-CoA epoxidase subunit PaaC [Alicyclobacillus cycloheptanicus]MDQ0188686.1 ring-1,2-phenylacetyl-CoA epoxidase subunit PaaC [Alicyclobacillus cycloheptanicus]WDM00642.1 phenylacetate-CoA oxygenase subunit PaaC [Alicyclobacillus cycloheptanicus]